jgi:hypothetical protein
MFVRNDVDELVGRLDLHADPSGRTRGKKGRDPAAWFDERHDRIVAHRDPAPGDDDLLDCAAVMTLRQGSAVIVVDRTQLRPAGPAAAILRY